MGELNIGQKKQLQLLQDHLGIFRKLAGWSMEELAARVGFSKQTVSNLENKKTELTLTQYIAIRAVLDYEIQTHPEKPVLQQAIDVLLNENDRYSLQEQAEYAAKAAVITAAIAGGASQAMLLSALGAGFLPAFTPLGAAAALAGEMGLRAWMGKIMPKQKNKNR